MVMIMLVDVQANSLYNFRFLNLQSQTLPSIIWRFNWISLSEWDLYNKTLFLIPDITLFDWHQTKDAFLILKICQTFTYCDVISAFANYVTKACQPSWLYVLVKTSLLLKFLT